MDLKTKLYAFLSKIKLPLLILALGFVFMLFPGGHPEDEQTADPDSRIQQVLCRTRGVGDAQVVISETGVVVACEGADDPKVRLDIIRAIGSYTGFGSDRITILKLVD